MEYLYIENNTKKLYSIYHKPEISDNNSIGVVLCYPMGQEYIRCHKLFVILAQKLALKGFHTLRFDYFGTGDSAGDFRNIKISELTGDIGLAINELQAGCDVSKIVLIGVRFGATLSMFYAEKEKIDGLVLWSPVCNGNKYLNEMKSSQKKWLEGSFAKQKKHEKGTIESLGYLYSKELCKEIGEISIKKINSTAKILVIDEDDNLLNIGETNISHKRLVNKEFWQKRDNENDKSLVPVFEIDTIIKWILRIND